MKKIMDLKKIIRNHGQNVYLVQQKESLILLLSISKKSTHDTSLIEKEINGNRTNKKKVRKFTQKHVQYFSFLSASANIDFLLSVWTMKKCSGSFVRFLFGNYGAVD